MRIFSGLLAATMRWAESKYAPYYLSAVSSSEAAFFPIPPDVILIPMVLARPDNAWRLAWLTTWTAVIGALLGYAIGYYGVELLLPHIEQWGYLAAFNEAKTFFGEYGIWAVLIGSFTPIPFKVFTITAGAMDMSLLPFIAVAFFGRAKRFYLVAAVMKYGGVRALPIMQKYSDAMGWSLVAVVIVGLVVWKIMHS
ncbi:MAG: DedA family protein [Proteobacteria bacterium]|nr:DedA family protein [Pseudomonadota bacterium]